MITHILLCWREISICVAQAPNILQNHNTTKCPSGAIVSRSQLTCLKITLALPPAMTIRSPQSFMTAKTGNILPHVLLSHIWRWGLSPVFSRYSQAPKVFWDACFCAKMAADLFCIRVCVLFASFLVLTRGQNNRTVFLPSSTSGNSCTVVLIRYVCFDTICTYTFCVIFVTFASEFHQLAISVCVYTKTWESSWMLKELLP